MDNTRFYLGFNLVNGIGPARLDRLIDFCGSIEAAWRARPADVLAAGLDARSAHALRLAQRTVDLDTELERAAQAGIQLLTREHAAYPAVLAQIPAPPPLLYVRGRLAAVDAWSVAVVGTRSPTSYGKEAARRLAGDLAGAGVTVISGLAIGIDTLAHTAALEAGGRTIAVLACGADLVYPERNRALAEQICQAGAIISEFPLGAKPTPQMFPVRNRLISGLALGTLVIEAGISSGALITVDYALEQGRDVFAVPGSIFSKVSQGTNQLLRNGATIATSAQDMLEALNLNAATAQQEIQLAFPDDPAEAALLDLVSYEPQHIDELRRASGLAVADVSAMLAMMELKGLVRQAGALQYVRVRELRAEYLAATQP
ncbi:MAG: DNA-protecting protein DprA [Kouleothrix sp.]|jgi:DNA processing protein|nr:DNA-protecting protein DprA [Kouleothrix sp.]